MRVSIKMRRQRHCERSEAIVRFVKALCQRGASPLRVEPYHVKSKVTASLNSRGGLGPFSGEAGWRATGGESVARRMTNPFRRDGSASLRL